MTRAPGMTPERRRDMVVQAALPLVAEYGAAVTTAQIARAAGIGEATIFRVFADKDAVLDAVVAAALDDMCVREELAAIPLDQPLEARLVEAVDAIRAHFDRVGTVIAALHASGHRRSRRDLAPEPFGRRPDSVEADRRSDALPAAEARPAADAPAAAGEADDDRSTTPPRPGDHRSDPPAPGDHRSDPPAPGDHRAEPHDRRAASRDAVREAVDELFAPDADQLRLPVPILTDMFLAQLFGRDRRRTDPPVTPEDLVDLFLHGAVTR